MHGLDAVHIHCHDFTAAGIVPSTAPCPFQLSVSVHTKVHQMLWQQAKTCQVYSTFGNFQAYCGGVQASAYDLCCMFFPWPCRLHCLIHVNVWQEHLHLKIQVTIKRQRACGLWLCQKMHLAHNACPSFTVQTTLNSGFLTAARNSHLLVTDVHDVRRPRKGSYHSITIFAEHVTSYYVLISTLTVIPGVWQGGSLLRCQLVEQQHHVLY